MSSLIKIDTCKVQYGKRLVLDVNDIDFQSGDVVAIIGENGSGKTTLIKAILHIISYQGHIDVNVPFSEIGIDMQKNEYHELMKVKEIIGVFLNETEKSIEENQLAHTFKILELLDKKIAMLSGGELQRLTLFLVIYNQPTLLICDEPTTGLDTQTRTEITKYLKSMFTDRSGVVVSHYFQEIVQLANKILILHQGKLLFFGSIEDYIMKFNHYVMYANEDVIEKEKIAIFRSFSSDTGKKIIIIENTKENIKKIKKYSEQSYIKPVGLKEAYLLHIEIGEERYEELNNN